MTGASDVRGRPEFWTRPKMPGRLQSCCLPGIKLGLLAVLVAASQLSIAGLVLALDIVPDAVTHGSQAKSPTDAENQLVSYDASFFDRYQPNTALDMVNQLPGFQLDDGDDRRGFGGSLGNLLINDR